jgi:hypothetical protein
MTIDDLFHYVGENGSYQYFEDHILHNAGDLIARNNGDPIFCNPDRGYDTKTRRYVHPAARQGDGRPPRYNLFFYPFWVTTIDSDPSRKNELAQLRASLSEEIEYPKSLDFALNEPYGISKHAIGRDPIPVYSAEDLISIYRSFYPAQLFIIDRIKVHLQDIPFPEVTAHER